MFETYMKYISKNQRHPNTVKSENTVESMKFVGANFHGLLGFYGFVEMYFVDLYICKKDNSRMSLFVEDVNS
jgi:hypothetical protein